MILTREQALEIFKRRVSVRYYDPARKISAEDFAAILDFGRLSPSSVGCEPWQFVVVQNAALREKIKPFAGGCRLPFRMPATSFSCWHENMPATTAPLLKN
ncbi:hypothetical protein HMPREF1028_01165 [Neisseria sp. GT4A_CT1]|nr:hypothetical protein HMPREF1028_01165 [Neisseria sp. GT4A_CT1]